MSKNINSVLSPNTNQRAMSRTQSSVLSTQSLSVSPLELLNLYYSDGQSLGNRENKLWQKMNALLSWENILNKGYQADLCPLLYYIITKWLPALSVQRLVAQHLVLSPQHLVLRLTTSLFDSKRNINGVLQEICFYLMNLAGCLRRLMSKI